MIGHLEHVARQWGNWAEAASPDPQGGLLAAGSRRAPVRPAGRERAQARRWPGFLCLALLAGGLGWGGWLIAEARRFETGLAAVRRLMDAVSSGSYLAISHPIDTSAEMNEAARVWNEASPVKIWPRPEAEIRRFFAGLELAGPGVVSLPDWLPDQEASSSVPGIFVPHYCGVARKA